MFGCLWFRRRRNESSEVLVLLRALKAQGVTIMAKLDALEAEVHETAGIIQSAITLITGIATELEDAKTDPAKIQELADKLNTSSEALAAAVAANSPEDTPVEPPADAPADTPTDTPVE